MICVFTLKRHLGEARKRQKRSYASVFIARTARRSLRSNLHAKRDLSLQLVFYHSKCAPERHREAKKRILITKYVSNGQVHFDRKFTGPTRPRDPHRKTHTQMHLFDLFPPFPCLWVGSRLENQYSLSHRSAQSREVEFDCEFTCPTRPSIPIAKIPLKTHASGALECFWTTESQVRLVKHGSNRAYDPAREKPYRTRPSNPTRKHISKSALASLLESFGAPGVTAPVRIRTRSQSVWPEAATFSSHANLRTEPHQAF